MNPYALLDPAVTTAHHAVVHLAAALPWPGGGGSVAAALILLTLALRAALAPFAVRRARQQQIRTTLAPQVARLRERYAADPQRLFTETARLHAEAGVPLTAGMIPALLQLPLIATVYRLVVVPTVAGGPNLVLAAHVFGAPLAAHWPEAVAASGLLGPGGLALIVLLLALLALATASSRDAVRSAGDQPAGMIRVFRWLPYGTVLFAVTAPVAVGLYLLAANAWTVAERRVLARRFPPIAAPA